MIEDVDFYNDIGSHFVLENAARRVHITPVQTAPFHPNIPSQSGVAMSDRQQKANVIINSYTGFATTAAVIPIPVADTVAISGLQVAMVVQLGNLYGQPIGKDLAKGLLGVFLAAKVGEWLASLAKTIPGLGTVGGGIVQMVIAGSMTYSLGQAVVSVLEKGQPLTKENVKREKDNQDPEELKRKQEELKRQAERTKEAEKGIGFDVQVSSKDKSLLITFDASNYSTIHLSIVDEAYEEIFKTRIKPNINSYKWSYASEDSSSYMINLTCDDLLPVSKSVTIS